MKDSYTVTLYQGPAIPFIFAVHHWLVISQNSKSKRFEVTYEKDSEGKYLRTNLLPPTRYSILPYRKKPTLEGKAVFKVTGGKNSLACKLYEIIEESLYNYPHLYDYSNLGPNSNSYIQWILGKLPELEIQLPRNAIGKNYSL